MAARSWANSIFTAIGVAAGAGAAQLGLGYGLGIISWQVPETATGSGPDDATIWVMSLAWVAWLAATSTVAGALCADRLSSISEPASGNETVGAKAVTAAWRVIIALSAAVGALITVPLVAVPARAPRPDNVAPYFTAGGYAVAGVIVGLLIAIAALSARAIAANIIASSVWIGALAVIAVIDAVEGGGQLAGTAQLATWQFTDAVWVRGMVNLPGALLMVFVALIIGALASLPAGRRGDNRIGVAISGAAGPMIVAVAYLFAAPSVGERDQNLSAFVMAPYAVLAGLAGSVLIAVIGPKGARAAARAQRSAAEEERARADELADWAQALAAAEAARTGTHGSAHRDEPESGTDLVGTSPAATSSLETDAYAPARAYTADPAAREYAADTVEEESGGSAGTATATATGRATVGQPLWPSTGDSSATEEPTTGTTDRSKLRGRRARGSS